MTQTETKEISGLDTQRTELRKIYRWIFELGAAALVLFYIYSAGFGSANEQFHLGFYMLLTFALIGIFYRCRKNSPVSRPSLIDLGMIALSIFTIGYWIVEYPDLVNRAGNYSHLDIFVGAVAIVISFEVSRRTVGWALPIIAIIGILYALVGRSLPDAISHHGFTLRRIIEYCYFSQAGVFGIMANVMATYVILFIFFGAFLEKSGVGQFFINLPMSLAGRSPGGAAKVSVMTSGFFGSVAGSAIANTVATGTFTIPLMKRTGFRPHIAGAVEASASVGGQFLPPVMGAGAFLMAERTGLPYSQIALLSIVPAVLYFLSVWVMVHFEAKKQGIERIQDSEIPKFLPLLKKRLVLLTTVAHACRHLNRWVYRLQSGILLDSCYNCSELLPSRDTTHTETYLGSDGDGCKEFACHWRCRGHYRDYRRCYRLNRLGTDIPGLSVVGCRK